MSEVTVKKAFVGIVELLQANTHEKVSKILPEILALAAAQKGGGGKATSFHRNEAGKVVAVLCSYHKLWMDPAVAEFGKKVSSSSGLNPLCMDGNKKFSRQSRKFDDSNKDLLLEMVSGEVSKELAAELIKEFELEKATIVPREDGYGFETLDECLADSKARGLHLEEVSVGAAA